MLRGQNHGIYKKLYTSVHMTNAGSTDFLKSFRNQKPALKSLAHNFYNDKSARSRSKAYALSRNIYNYTEKPEIKQQVVEDHLNGCLSDRSPYLRSRLAYHLLNFDSIDFNKSSLAMLEQLIESDKNKKHYVVVAASNNFSDVLPNISNLSPSEIYESFDVVQGLAQVGSSEALKICRTIIEEYPLDIKFFEKYLPGLAFTRDRKVIDLIIQEILSDENTDLIGQRLKDYQRYFMMKNIIPIIYEFPYNFDDESQLIEKEFYHQLHVTMDWLRANKDSYTLVQEGRQMKQKDSRYLTKELTGVIK